MYSHKDLNFSQPFIIWSNKIKRSMKSGIWNISYEEAYCKISSRQFILTGAKKLYSSSVAYLVLSSWFGSFTTVPCLPRSFLTLPETVELVDSVSKVEVWELLTLLAMVILLLAINEFEICKKGKNSAEA